MNHLDIYHKLYLKGKEREIVNPLTGYSENHHFIPRCMLGDDSPENLVRLTAKEHYIAHVLLCKIFPENASLLCAWNNMRIKSNNQNRYIPSREYKELKELFSKSMSLLHTGHKYWVGKKHTKNSINKISKSLKGNSHTLGFKHSEETRNKMSKSQLEYNNSELGKETISRRSAHMVGNNYGSNQSQERRDATSLRMKTNPPRLGISNRRLICKYCQSDTTSTGLTQYHGYTSTRPNVGCRKKSLELNTSWSDEEQLISDNLNRKIRKNSLESTIIPEIHQSF